MSASVGRIIYKHLLRTSSTFDKHRVFRFFWSPRWPKLYIPNQVEDINFRDEVRARFRVVRSEQERVVALGQAFQAIREINLCLSSASQQIPWHNRTPEPKFNDQSLVKLVQSPFQIKPGMVLIAHPSATSSLTKSVFLVTSISKDNVKTVCLCGEWAESDLTKKVAFLSSIPENLEHPVLKVLEGLNYSENPPANSSLFECRVNVASWPVAELKEDLERGGFLLASCPLSVLFQRTEIDSSIYDLTTNINDKSGELWKRLLAVMGGECELGVYCFEEPPQELKDLQD